MKIAICGSASDGGRSGISTYMRQMVATLPAAGSQHEFELLIDEDDVEPIATGADVTVIPLSRRLRGPVRNILWHQAELPLMVARRGYDALFIPSGNRRLPFHVGCPTVGTVHDLASFHVSGKYDRWRDVYVKRVLPRLIRRLTHVITPSRATRDDVMTHCGVPGERVTVIPEAVDTAVFRPGDRRAALDHVRTLGVRPPFLLYVSRIEHPGKNHVRLIDAFARLKAFGAPHQLVFAGTDRERADEVHARAAGCGYRAAIKFLGFVPDESLPSLYRAADALAFPSLHEGFGLPVLEAMACGLPVACGRVASLPEVAGSAALYFEPTSVESIAEALRSLVECGPLRAALAGAALRRADEFSVSATARRTLAVIEAAAASARARASAGEVSSRT